MGEETGSADASLATDIGQPSLTTLTPKITITATICVFLFYFWWSVVIHRTRGSFSCFRSTHVRRLSYLCEVHWVDVLLISQKNLILACCLLFLPHNLYLLLAAIFSLPLLVIRRLFAVIFCLDLLNLVPPLPLFFITSFSLTYSPNSPLGHINF